MPSPYGAVLVLSLLSVLTTVLGVALSSLIGTNDRAIAVGIGFSTGMGFCADRRQVLIARQFRETREPGFGRAFVFYSQSLFCVRAPMCVAAHPARPVPGIFQSSKTRTEGDAVEDDPEIMWGF